jgi:predicted metal-dependent phosphotriesterase family hydrolase
VSRDEPVTTVLGPVPGDQLGVVLPHEHLVADTTCYYRPPQDEQSRELADAPVEITKLGLLRRNLFALRDNLVLTDLETAVSEADEFRELGGGTIVDLTLPEIGRDPGALQAISRRTGLHVVMGCGHYIHLAHPRGLDHEPVESIADRLLDELASVLRRLRDRQRDRRPGSGGRHPRHAQLLTRAACAHRPRRGFTIRSPPADTLICRGDEAA